MRGDQTVFILRQPETDWQGDPIGEAVSEFVADDCAFVRSINTDDGQLVSGQGQLLIFPGAEAIPEPEDQVGIGSQGIWEIDGDVAPISKGGDIQVWMMNVRKQI